MQFDFTRTQKLSFTGKQKFNEKPLQTLELTIIENLTFRALPKNSIDAASTKQQTNINMIKNVKITVLNSVNIIEPSDKY